MRLSYALLVAAATTLLASTTATTVLGRLAEVSTMESADLPGMDQRIGDEKRSLRNHEDDRDNDEDKENIDGDGEERFKTIKLQDLLAGRTNTLFQKWKTAGYSEAKVRDKMNRHITSGILLKFTRNDVDDVVRRYKDIL
ncbi:Avirulence (Avh) protein [Phytophthora megakarya]|uniref:RxLR effector protein n=1 Tax=Phytophthora megakarya TaxID=4795 RepID=A0A225VHF2_9STRA|nr:Avirulence (Avh) protein [Phytophthora megakarya]